MERDPFALRIEEIESGGDPYAISPKGAIGAMQVMPSTLRQPGFNLEPLPEDQWSDPEALRGFGDNYLRALVNRYEGDEELAAVAYNAGYTVADKLRDGVISEEQLPDETQDYLQKYRTGGRQEGEQPPVVQPASLTELVTEDNIPLMTPEMLEEFSATYKQENVTEDVPSFTKDDMNSFKKEFYDLDNVAKYHNSMLQNYKKFWMNSPNATDEEAQADYISSMRDFDSNSIGAVDTLRQIAYANPQKRATFVEMLNHWDNVPLLGEGWESAGENLWRALLDPVNLASFGVASLAAKAGQSTLKVAVKAALVDALGSAGTDIAQQSARVEAGVQDDVSLGQAAAVGAMGGSLTLAPGAIGFGIGRLLNKKPDLPSVPQGVSAEKDLEVALAVPIGQVANDEARRIVGGGLINSTNLDNLNASESAGDFIRMMVKSDEPMPKVTLDEINARAQNAGVATFSDTELATWARAKGLTKEEIATSPELAVQLRNQLVTAAENFTTLSAHIRQVRGTTGHFEGDPKFQRLLAARNQQFLIFEKLQARNKASARNAGMLLRSYAIKADGNVSQLQMLYEMNGQMDLDKLADRLLDGEGLDKLAAEKDWLNTAVDGFSELFYNGILGSPDTFVINFGGSLYNNLSKNGIEALLAGGVGKLRGNKATYSWEQAMGRTKSLNVVRDGTLLEALKVGLEFVKRDRPTQHWGKLLSEQRAKVAGMVDGPEKVAEAARLKNMETRATQIGNIGRSDLRDESLRATIPGLPGYIVRVPGRLMSATDAFNKHWAMKSAIRGLAAEDAIKQGLVPGSTAFRRHIVAMTKTPTSDMKRQVFAEALETTFQTQNGFTQFISKLQNPSDGALGKLSGTFVRTVVPFANTPANLVKWGFERTPVIGHLMSKHIPVEERIARQMHGATLIGLGMTFYSQGWMTGGGPDELDEMLLMQQAGWNPYAIGGDYGISRLDPAAWPFQLGAAAMEAWNKADDLPDNEKDSLRELIVNSMDSALNTMEVMVVERTFLENLGRFARAMRDPNTSAMDALGEHSSNVAGSLIPGYLNRTGQYTDEFARRSQGPVEKMMHRMPIMREYLPTRADAFGQAIKEAEGWPSDIVALFRASVIPEHKEMFDLAVEHNVELLRSPKSIDGMELTSKERSMYEAIQGLYAMQLLEKTVENARHIPKEERLANSMAFKKYFEDTFRVAQKAAEIDVYKQLSNPVSQIYNPARASQIDINRLIAARDAVINQKAGNDKSNYETGKE